jgi:hypothetical protein
MPLVAAAALWSVLQLSAANYPTTVQSFNPLGYWRLSESVSPPAANLVVNSGTLGAAANGYPYPGTDLVNGQPGVIGTSISFTNPSASFNYDTASLVDVPWNAVMNPNGPFTVEFWAKPNGHASDLVCPICSLDVNQNRSGWLVYLDGPNNRWEYRTGGTVGYATTIDSANNSAVVGAWSHVVAVWNGSQASLYLNGVLVAGPVGITPGRNFTPNFTQPLRIGATTFPNRGYDGLLDEVALYGTALSGTTISNNYYVATHNAAGYSAQVLSSAPLGYWHMDDAVYVPPSQSSLPVTVNLGTLGSAANGTNEPGLTAGVGGPPFAGFPAGNLGSKLQYEAGNISLGNPSGLNFSNQITFVAWVKPQFTDGLRNIISHGYISSGGTNLEVQMRINGGDYEVGSWTGSGEGATATGGLATQDIGSWVFLAGTFDGASWNLYRYDELIASGAGANGALEMDGIPWSIGSRGDTSDDGRFFGGTIDEVAVFNTALTQAQIQQIFYSAQMSPIIITPPVPPSGTVYEGSTLDFNVVAAGNPTLLYQWTKNTTPIPGETGTSLTLNNVTTTSSGTYAIVVTNNYGSITSSFPVTVVAGPPLLTSQPQSTTRFVGANVSFSSTAVGSPTLTYQWYFNTNTSISGATGNTYAKNNVQLADGGKYNLRVTNPYGATNSDYATLSVVSAPTTAYPQIVLADNPLGFWRLDEASGAVAHDNWGGHDGVYNSVTLGASGYSPLDTDKAASFGAQNSYVGEISGFDFSGGGKAFSIEAWVNGAASQAVDGAVIVAKGRGANGAGGTLGEQFLLDVTGGKFRFDVQSAATEASVSADVGPNGTWQHIVGVYDGPNGALRIFVNGTEYDSLTPPPGTLLATASPVDIGAGLGGVTPIHDLFFTGTIDEVAIYNYALTASQVHNHVCGQYGSGQAPLVLIQPTSAKDFIGWPINIGAAVAGSCDLTFQWRKNNVNLTDNGTITGSASNIMTISALSPADAGNYTLVAANSIGRATTSVATVTVVAAPTNSVPVPNLVMHLKFDGNLVDDTGRANNGTGKHALFGAISTVTPGPANGGAFEYVSGGNLANGQPYNLGQGLHYSSDAGPPRTGVGSTYGTNDYYVALGVRPDLKFGTGDFTVAYWIRLPPFFEGGDLPFFCDSPNSTGGPGFTFATAYGSNGLFSAGTEVNSGGWGYSLNTTRVEGPWYSLNDGAWHHLVHSFTRSGNGITYLDGVQVHSLAINGVGNLTTANPASIGQDPSGLYSETGSADIDDLGVWKRALTPFESKTLYVAGTNSVTFVDITPSIAMLPGNTISVTWQSGVLQQADNVTGPFTDVSGATSPYNVPATATKKFYRTRQ